MVCPEFCYLRTMAFLSLNLSNGTGTMHRPKGQVRASNRMKQGLQPTAGLADGGKGNRNRESQRQPSQMDLVVSRGYCRAPALLCPGTPGSLRVVRLGLYRHRPLCGHFLLPAKELGSGSRPCRRQPECLDPGGEARRSHSGRFGPAPDPSSGFGTCPLSLQFLGVSQSTEVGSTISVG